MTYQPGDEVTVLRPSDRDPYPIVMSPRVRIARERRGPGGELFYEVEIPHFWMIDDDGKPIRDGGGAPVLQRFGPIPESRLTAGWR